MSDIDKIFSEKLKNWEKLPSDRAWERINGNLEDKRKKGFIWYSIAASILLIILTGIFFIIERREEQPSIVELPRTERKPATVPISRDPELASIPKSTVPNIPTTRKVKVHQSKEDKKEVAKKVKGQDRVFDEPMSITDTEVEDINAEEVVFSQEKEEIIEENKSYLVNTVQPIEIIIKKGNGVSTVGKIDTTDKRKSKWGRAYEQMVNLKNGEKVDLQEFSGLLAFHKKDKENSK